MPEENPYAGLSPEQLRTIFKDYREKTYLVEVDVGPNPGDFGVGSITVDTRPIVVTYIKHQIVDDNNFPAKTANDGLYRIDWSISEVTRFYSGGGAVPMADASYGTARTGVFIPLDPPIAIRDTLVLNVKIINAWGPRPGDITVQVLFKGYEKKPQSWNDRGEGPGS